MVYYELSHLSVGDGQYFGKMKGRWIACACHVLRTLHADKRDGPARDSNSPDRGTRLSIFVLFRDLTKLNGGMLLRAGRVSNRNIRDLICERMPIQAART